MTNTTTYGQQVRLARNLKDFSQEALAIATGLSKRTIQNVEAGGNPGPETKRALAAVLGDALASPAEQPRIKPEAPSIQCPSPSTVSDMTSTQPVSRGSVVEEASRPRRLNLGQRIAGEDSWGAGVVDAVIKWALSMIVIFAVMLTYRYLYGPNLWITVEARYQGLSPEQEASSLSDMVTESFPEVRHVEPLSATTQGLNARRVFSAVAHGTDPAALSAFLAHAGMEAEVTTVAPMR